MFMKGIVAEVIDVDVIGEFDLREADAAMSSGAEFRQANQGFGSGLAVFIGLLQHAHRSPVKRRSRPAFHHRRLSHAQTHRT
jgi:hypothetical protein